MKLLRFLLLLIFGFTSAAFGQIELVQPLEKDLKKNILFGHHKHFFKVKGKEKILSVQSSVGSVNEITDSSFKYFMHFKVSSGSVKFIVQYTKMSRIQIDTLFYKFVPTTRFTWRITNLAGKKPSPSELKSGNIKFNFFYDNEPVECELLCYVLVNVTKCGEMPAPMTCCNGIDADDKKNCLSKINPRKGDRIFFEQPSILYLGKEINTDASFELRY